MEKRHLFLPGRSVSHDDLQFLSKEELIDIITILNIRVSDLLQALGRLDKEDRDENGRNE